MPEFNVSFLWLLLLNRLQGDVELEVSSKKSFQIKKITQKMRKFSAFF